MENFKPGRYRHFKGGEYELLGVAKHSETLEPMVVYRALYGEGGLWVRPAAMWTEIVERDGQSFRRFTPVEEAESRPKSEPDGFAGDPGFAVPEKLRDAGGQDGKS